MAENQPAGETVTETDGFELIKLDDGRGAVKQTVDRAFLPTTTVYDDYHTARLAYGLRLEAGAFSRCPSDDCVPLAVAKAGTDAIAAYLLIRDPDEESTHKEVADTMDVGVQTVRNYAHRVRWSPE